MGPQQVLRAVAGVLIASSVAVAAPAAREPVAVIDLGPPDGGAARRAIDQAAIAAGLSPVLDDGAGDALAGIATYRDDVPLASAMADAGKAFGELSCPDAIAAANRALGLLATRQAAGLAVPELPRALAYVLLCADRTGDPDLARRAADGLRRVAPAGTPEVPQSLLDKYPEIDSVADRDLIELDVTTTPPGATLLVDYAPAGTTPAHLVLPAGEHVIAAAAGTHRGYVVGTATHAQKTIDIPLTDTAGRWSKLAARVGSWHGQLPPPAELDRVLAKVHARVALIRHGNTVEAWGHAGRAEPLIRLGGADGIRPLAEADRAAALVADRVQTWSERAPDPDRPLLLEDRAARDGGRDEPTRWWVYASIAGAVLAGAIVIYAHDQQSTTQHVELHFP